MAINSIKAQEVTGLTGFSIFIDQGHSQNENTGLYSYSEAEKVLRVGLHLRELLLSQTDIDTVYVARETDSDQVSLSQRTDRANALGADFYYSIHSDAGGPNSNSTLFMYGGWRQNGVTVEKSPKGGKDFANIMENIHPRAIRINSRGVYADRTYYQGFPTSHTNTWAYLHVNRQSNMASMLSESGFHTNPYQQQRNMNAEYKKLEAQSAYWTVLEYLGADRPPRSILTGEITNTENGELLNGATVTIDGKSYTTDTYASLFNQYSSNPDLLGNGFYYIEDLSPGMFEVVASAPDFYSDTLMVSLSDSFFTFQDFSITSFRAPYLASTFPDNNDTTIYPGQDIVLTFSRPMDQASVDSVLKITPQVDFIPVWTSDRVLTISTADFAFLTDYSLTIDSTARDASPFAHRLDGDNDGEAGGNFELNFKTNRFDVVSPTVMDFYPTNTRLSELNTIIGVTFSEPLDTTSFGNQPIRFLNAEVPGTIVYYPLGKRSVLSFFPDNRLAPNRNNIVSISGALSDSLGNALGSDVIRSFPTSNEEPNSFVTIDNFDDDLSRWWEPQQSGSTSGIITEQTSRSLITDKVNLLTNSTSALQINYGWDPSEGVAEHLIRLYTPNTTPKFTINQHLQAYVFGDGSGNQFRFMLRDGNNELEGSPWYTVDWLGWRLIRWDLSAGNAVPWVNGNGTLNGNLYLDSIQLTHVLGQDASGFLVVDDLQAVLMGLPVSNEEEYNSEIPSSITLDQNYPNPFNPSTTIQFGLPNQTTVRIELYDMLGRNVDTILNATKPAGVHVLSYDASHLASGIYIYRMTIGSNIIAKKMTLIK